MTGQTRRNEYSRERAVSDAISFTLMFAIIITGVGVVSLGGLAEITSFSETEEVRSAERGMVSTAATLDGINQRGDFNRSFSLALKNGQIWVNETELNVTAGANWNDTISINSLQHRIDQSPGEVTVRYEGGGVFRSDSSVPGYEPSFRCRDDGVAVISLVNITLAQTLQDVKTANSYNDDINIDQYSAPTEAPVANFDEALLFEARLIDTNRTIVDSGAQPVVLNATNTAGPEEWDFYFENLAERDDASWDSRPGPTVACNADETVLRITTMELEVLLP